MNYSLLWRLRSLSLVERGRRGVCRDLIAFPARWEHDDVTRNQTDAANHITPMTFNVISVFSEPDRDVRLVGWRGVFATL
ncbi:DNA-directed RNA polymerase subunit beta [Labeo rohita]|uniref:DNA-directed RNA polymerase subunit beta n=1 Tax=Labeo rohita TaxID=84645 RepID=A0ABQ8LLW3_LABRO|nr:DNA-directed RNA polymerase subunit beta [Labeo rohita]